MDTFINVKFIATVLLVPKKVLQQHLLVPEEQLKDVCVVLKVLSFHSSWTTQKYTER